MASETHLLEVQMMAKGSLPEPHRLTMDYKYRISRPTNCWKDSKAGWLRATRVSEGVRLPCRRCSSRLLRGDVKYAIHADGYSEQHHQACDGHGNPDTPRFLPSRGRGG